MGIFTKPISGAAELVALTGQGMLQSVGYNTLPMPMNLFLTDNKTLLPLVEKIIEDQLPQLLSQHLVLYSCKATFIRKNDLKNAMIILLSNAFVILDLDVDSVYDIIRLEKIAPVGTDASNDADHSNLFSFKLKEEVKRKPKNPENSENMNEYKVSSRTRQYVLDTSGYQSGNLMFDYRPDNYDSDSSNSGSRKKSVIPTSNVTEDVTEIQSGSKNCLSFFINDEFSGKYLCSYVMLLKQDLNSKDQAFPMFDLQ